MALAVLGLSLGRQLLRQFGLVLVRRATLNAIFVLLPLHLELCKLSELVRGGLRSFRLHPHTLLLIAILLHLLVAVLI